MKVYITRKIPEAGEDLLRKKGYEVDVNPADGILKKEALLMALANKEYDAVLSLLTDRIDAEVFNAVPKAKIFANYAVGFNNIDTEEAKKRGIVITNTPDVLTDSVAEHTFAMILALSSRIVEGDRFMREGKYKGWEPMLLLGMDLKDKTLGILGAGRIGARLAYHAKDGFDMNIIYFDVARNEEMESDLSAKYYATVEEVLKKADVVSIHVPLLDSTKHLLNAERIALMKPNAILVNTSRGAVIDEAALVKALKEKKIRSAGLDVFENEPMMAEGLSTLENVVLTPHIASATEETRSAMSEIAAKNIIEVLEGRSPLNPVI